MHPSSESTTASTCSGRPLVSGQPWRALLLLAAAACGDSPTPPTGVPAGGSAGSAGSGGSNLGGSNLGGSNLGGSGAAGSGAAGSGAAGAGTGDAGSGACGLSVEASPPTSAAHVTLCSDVTYETNPPSGGSHYAVWPAFQSYDFALPAGFLVHGLEHGAVVFWYNCPDGCADEVSQAEALLAQLAEDPMCAGTGADRRAIVVPYPSLGSRWGASAWGFALTADCFDPSGFEAFYIEHYGNGPEALCIPGQAYTEDPCQ